MNCKLCRLNKPGLINGYCEKCIGVFVDPAIEHWVTPEQERDAILIQFSEEVARIDAMINDPLARFEGECRMCGKEASVNGDGYCSQCWQVWNS